MTADDRNDAEQRTQLFSCYVSAAEDGLNKDAVMLCEVVGEEIHSVSLRVAAEGMSRWLKPPNSSR